MTSKTCHSGGNYLAFCKNLAETMLKQAPKPMQLISLTAKVEKAAV
jgi:hypothetical protein